MIFFPPDPSVIVWQEKKMLFLSQIQRCDSKFFSNEQSFFSGKAKVLAIKSLSSFIAASPISQYVSWGLVHAQMNQAPWLCQTMTRSTLIYGTEIIG